MDPGCNAQLFLKVKTTSYCERRKYPHERNYDLSASSPVQGVRHVMFPERLNGATLAKAVTVGVDAQSYLSGKNRACHSTLTAEVTIRKAIQLDFGSLDFTPGVQFWILYIPTLARGLVCFFNW